MPSVAWKCMLSAEVTDTLFQLISLLTVPRLSGLVQGCTTTMVIRSPLSLLVSRLREGS